MKDYSLNLEERKDFILRYDVTEDGMIKIIFAKGKPWYVPYNKENEKKILDKMRNQLDMEDMIEPKLKSRIFKNAAASIVLLGVALLPFYGMDSSSTLFLISFSSIFTGAGLISGISAIKNNNKLKDLKKNVKFLDMEEKLNKIVRSDENTLVDVSNKTKSVIADFPEDRDVFDINSFNYVPFKDLEQIMENSARNERFGFDYSNHEEPAEAIVRKRVR